MENPKNDQYYTSKMIADMEFIIKHMKDVSIESFGQNEVLQDSMDSVSIVSFILFCLRTTR